MGQHAAYFLIALAMATSQAGPARAAESAGRIIEDGSIALSLRYRYEHANEDGFDENANASTLRSRLTFESGSYRGGAFLLEVDDVRELFLDDFDASSGNTPRRSQFPVVADPEGTEINQAYLELAGNPAALGDTRLRLGRQRIELDNERFVGGVGWRQNEQTYDALSVRHDGARVDLFYALVDNVNRVFGERVPAGDHRQSGTHLLNVGIDAFDDARLSAYHYAIDNDDASAFSSHTTGLRLTGTRALTELTWVYQAEYATQRDGSDNPSSYRADYWHLNGGAKVAATELTAGWEVLGGDADAPGESFRTPLATLHAFNGWADRFLSTPDAGLDDRYLRVRSSPGAWSLEAAVHRFSAEDGDERFGDELDLRVGRRVGEHVQLDLFTAWFEGESGIDDVTRVWLMVSASL